jgi:hypothetical protein
MKHVARAQLSPGYAKQFVPALDALHGGLTATNGPAALVRPLRRCLRLLGFEIVNRRGVDQLDLLRRRGLIAGGAAFADYLETEIIDHVFRNSAIFSAPANVFVALYTSATSDAGGGAEVSGGGYARVAVATSSGWTGSGGATDNAADIDFGTAAANWGTVTHVGVRDAASGGNLLVHGALTAAQTVNSGDSFKFAAGDLDISLD